MQKKGSYALRRKTAYSKLLIVPTEQQDFLNGVYPYINNLILGLQCCGQGLNISSLTFIATLQLR